MNEENYIAERVDKQLDWYEEKAALNKKLFIWKEGLVISFAALIPFILVWDPLESGKILSAALGMSITILSGVASTMKLEKKWTEYRTTAETLKHERFLYFTRSGHYQNPKPLFNEFVQRVENIISKENSFWNQYIVKNNNEKEDQEIKPS
ncbi:DUF4231 domain-containing protein [Algoriphagus sp. SE2]|uniref:DUF4231 domain-containing protein n=1 Tax=Algoriphagus sp. SE2 TaxID=3141536 RepID=UPI0031CD4D09